jgi:hypothetical protein
VITGRDLEFKYKLGIPSVKWRPFGVNAEDASFGLRLSSQSDVQMAADSMLSRSSTSMSSSPSRFGRRSNNPSPRSNSIELVFTSILDRDVRLSI